MFKKFCAWVVRQGWERQGTRDETDAEQIVHKQCAPIAIFKNEPADSVVKSETIKT